MIQEFIKSSIPSFLNQKFEQMIIGFPYGQNIKYFILQNSICLKSFKDLIQLHEKIWAECISVVKTLRQEKAMMILAKYIDEYMIIEINSLNDDVDNKMNSFRNWSLHFFQENELILFQIYLKLLCIKYGFESKNKAERKYFVSKFQDQILQEQNTLVNSQNYLQHLMDYLICRTLESYSSLRFLTFMENLLPSLQLQNKLDLILDMKKKFKTSNKKRLACDNGQITTQEKQSTVKTNSQELSGIDTPMNKEQKVLTLKRKRDPSYQFPKLMIPQKQVQFPRTIVSGLNSKFKVSSKVSIQNLKPSFSKKVYGGYAGEKIFCEVVAQKLKELKLEEKKQQQYNKEILAYDTEYSD